MRKVAFVLAMWAVLALGACSTGQTDLANFNRNLLAAACQNPAQTIANVPGGFITPNQATQALQALCAATFGTVAAPAAAVGNEPALPPNTPAA